jgi:hypothetical protein
VGASEKELKTASKEGAKVDAEVIDNVDLADDQTLGFATTRLASSYVSSVPRRRLRV